MPEFSTPFSGLSADRKITHAELVRAIRLMIAAEYEAVQLYTQLAESTDHDLAREVLMDIAEEEVVHAGEFLKLLQALAPEEKNLYAEGAAEVAEMAAGIAEASQPSASEESPAEPAAEAADEEGAIPEEPEEREEEKSADVKTGKQEAPSRPSVGNLFHED